MVSNMKFLILSTAAAFLAVAAPCSAIAADTEPATQDAATGGANSQTVDPQKAPAVPTSVCTAPQQYCLDREALNRAIFLPRADSDNQSSTVPKANLPQPYPAENPDRYRVRNSEKWTPGNSADRIDQFLD